MAKKWNPDAFGRIMQKYITAKSLSIFLTIVYGISLVPLLGISFYNYPSADDFTNGSACHQVWMQTGSVFAVLGEAFSRMCNEWMVWRGSFLASFLSALSPNLWGEKIYIITPWIVLAMLTFGTIYLLHAILVKAFKADKYVSHCVSMLMLFVTVQCMVGAVEAFYWYSGAINYTFTHGVCLVFYGLLISAAYDTGKKRSFDLVGASILGFLIGGGNQMTMLNAAIVLVVVIGFITVLKKWKEQKALAVPMGLFFVGFILNVAAPGNWVRAGGTNGMNPVKAVLVSFYYCLDYCMSKWSGWPVAVLVIALIPLFWHMTGKTKFKFQYPLIVVLFGYCLVSAMMTPPLFATGNLEAGRLQGLTFTMYILVLTLCVGYVTGWVNKKVEAVAEYMPVDSETGKTETVEAVEKAEMKMQKREHFTVNELWCLVGCLVFFVLAIGITIIPDSHYFAFSSAVTDLADGSAAAYGAAAEERTTLYQSGAKDIIVGEFEVQPKLLYFSDIKPDTNEWENQGVCRFYDLNSVKLLKKPVE